jgi:RNA polymerase sigma factor (sigma-70 family)
VNDDPNDAAGAALDAALHDVLPRVLAAVTKRCGDFAAAEDAVQEALLAAVAVWPRDGVPGNPAGWLFTVALRRLADANDAEQARRRREEHLASGRGEAFVVEPVPDEHLAEVGDETLALLFACCHPALAPSSSIPLMLRALCGLSTAAIARALLVPEATLAQRLVRAKQAIAGSGVPLLLPPADERERRFAAVLQTIYLLGNEGHWAATATPRCGSVAHARRSGCCACACASCPATPKPKGCWRCCC